jgi:hypothetical protein
MRRLLATATMLAALVAAGCGGSDNGGSDNSSQPSGSSLSKQEYITKADDACKQFNQRIKSIPGTAKTTKEAAALYRRVVKEADSFYKSFSALQPPAQDAALVSRYRSDLKESIGITNQVADAVANKDTKKVTQLSASAKRLQLDRRKIAKQYGFHYCGVAQ